MLCALPGDDWDQLDRLAVQLEGRVLPDSGDVVPRWPAEVAAWA